VCPRRAGGVGLGVLAGARLCAGLPRRCALRSLVLLWCPSGVPTDAPLVLPAGVPLVPQWGRLCQRTAVSTERLCRQPGPSALCSLVCLWCSTGVPVVIPLAGSRMRLWCINVPCAVPLWCCVTAETRSQGRPRVPPPPPKPPSQHPSPPKPRPPRRTLPPPPTPPPSPLAPLPPPRRPPPPPPRPLPPPPPALWSSAPTLPNARHRSQRKVVPIPLPLARDPAPVVPAPPANTYLQCCSPAAGGTGSGVCGQAQPSQVQRCSCPRQFRDAALAALAQRWATTVRNNYSCSPRFGTCGFSRAERVFRQFLRSPRMGSAAVAAPGLGTDSTDKAGSCVQAFAQLCLGVQHGAVLDCAPYVQTRVAVLGG